MEISDYNNITNFKIKDSAGAQTSRQTSEKTIESFFQTGIPGFIELLQNIDQSINYHPVTILSDCKGVSDVCLEYFL